RGADPGCSRVVRRDRSTDDPRGSEAAASDPGVHGAAPGSHAVAGGGDPRPFAPRRATPEAALADSAVVASAQTTPRRGRFAARGTGLTVPRAPRAGPSQEKSIEGGGPGGAPAPPGHATHAHAPSRSQRRHPLPRPRRLA